jgi:hypothetical protein
MRTKRIMIADGGLLICLSGGLWQMNLSRLSSTDMEVPVERASAYKLHLGDAHASQRGRGKYVGMLRHATNKHTHCRQRMVMCQPSAHVEHRLTPQGESNSPIVTRGLTSSPPAVFERRGGGEI